MDFPLDKVADIAILFLTAGVAIGIYIVKSFFNEIRKDVDENKAAVGDIKQMVHDKEATIKEKIDERDNSHRQAREKMKSDIVAKLSQTEKDILQAINSVNNNAVDKEHLNTHIKHLETFGKETRDQINSINDKLDSILTQGQFRLPRRGD